MSIPTAIARFRAKQSEQLIDTANILRPVGEPEFDPDTETFTRDVVTIYSSRPCKIRPASVRGEHEDSAGETIVGTPDSDGKFDVDTDVQRGDIVQVTSSLYDASMVGRHYTVKQVPADTWQIARVVTLEEYLPPLLHEVS